MIKTYWDIIDVNGEYLDDRSCIYIMYVRFFLSLKIKNI